MQLSAPINVLKLARSESELQESFKVISRRLSIEIIALLSSASQLSHNKILHLIIIIITIIITTIVVVNITITASFKLAVVLVSSVASTLVYMKWMLCTLALMSWLYSVTSFFSQWSLRKSDSSPLTATSLLMSTWASNRNNLPRPCSSGYPSVGLGNILKSIWMWPNPVHQ